MRFGVIGTGYWAAAVHAPGIVDHPHTELVGVWGRDPTTAERLATQFGAKPFSKVDELIAAVEAVAFSVPPDVQAELAVRAGAAGRSLLLEKPLALTVEAADRVVEAAQAPSVVFFTRRFDPGVSSWFRTEIAHHPWDGGQAIYLASIFEPGNPFGESPWRRERGALWDIGPHALALLLPTLGTVEQVAAVRGRADEVHVALRHATGVASSVTVSLTARTELLEVSFWGPEGVARLPDGVDIPAAYAAAIDALLTGDTQFDAAFGRDVIRVLATAEEQLSEEAGTGRRPPPRSSVT